MYCLLATTDQPIPDKLFFANPHQPLIHDTPIHSSIRGINFKFKSNTVKPC